MRHSPLRDRLHRACCGRVNLPPNASWHDGTMHPKRPWSFLLAAAALAGASAIGIASSCAPVLNYLEPDRPRYEGHYAVPDADPAFRVVTFNVKFARQIERAIRVLREDPALRGADLIALQEMDAEGVERIARALRMDYVYYPAVRHPGI